MTDLGALPGLPSTSAFGASYSDANGYVYVSDNATGVVYRIDPAARTVLRLANGPKATQNDGARCLTARTPTVTVAKSVAGRLQAADQFTVALADSAGTELTSATTSGTGTSATSANWPARIGADYQISERTADGSASPISGYTATVECRDQTRGTAIPTGGARPQWTFTVPDGDDFLCTVTNTPNAQPSLALAKTAAPIDPAAFTAGQSVTYTYVVTNTGTVPLTALAITEDAAAFTGTGPLPAPTCPAAPLAPGAQTTCTAAYTITAADVLRGSLRNTATATGTPPSGPPAVSPPSSAELLPRPRPGWASSRAPPPRRSAPPGRTSPTPTR